MTGKRGGIALIVHDVAKSAFFLRAQRRVNARSRFSPHPPDDEAKAQQHLLHVVKEVLAAFNSGFSLALQAKDVGIAAALGPAVDQPMALAQFVSQMTTEARRAVMAELPGRRPRLAKRRGGRLGRMEG